MVASEFLHQGAGFVRDVGRCFHIMYDQHIWCGHLPQDRLDGGKFSPISSTGCRKMVPPTGEGQSFEDYCVLKGKKRKIGGERYEARSRGHSSPVYVLEDSESKCRFEFIVGFAKIK